MIEEHETVLLGPYNERVRSLFAAPAHAAELPVADDQCCEARASACASGPQLLLRASVAKGKLLALRFRVFGCPHLCAAAEVFCEQFEGGPVNELHNFSVSEIMTTLGVPVEKTGRILLLEDAVRALLSQIEQAATIEDQ